MNSSPLQFRHGNVAPKPTEQIMIDALPEMRGNSVICTSQGLAQFADAAARLLPGTKVFCTFLDAYNFDQAIQFLGELPGNLSVACETDMPERTVEIVVLPLIATGEAELTRELIQTGHQRLQLNGKLYASTNNKNDVWLHKQLALIFRKLKRLTVPQGVLYVGTRTELPMKTRNFDCEFAFRDRGRLIKAFSRPGVFSHRRVDLGARRLMDNMVVDCGERVLEIGCGSGTVALAAALRAPDVTVHAVDSNTRAVQCCQYAAKLNGLTNLSTQVDAVGDFVNKGKYDLVVGNPPYYADFRIARHFLIAGWQALRPGGRILIVTKHSDWYFDYMPQLFQNVKSLETKGYVLMFGDRSG